MIKTYQPPYIFSITLKFMNIHQQIPDRNQHVFKVNPSIQKVVFIILLIFCLTPLANPSIALIMGIAIAQLTGNPFIHLGHKATNLLLKISVVGLGFGMNLASALKAGKEGIGFTIVSIISTLVLGFFLGKWLSIEKKASYLISAGTAICGGSAIAAISPVIKAEEKQISVALGCVFILNAIALFVFPVIGMYLHLSQQQFGVWCALAIHDTSSVVGAASKYGAQALEVATTVKLARALWIIPVAFISASLFKNKSKKIAIPYFIGLFLLAMLANTYLPIISVVRVFILNASKAGLTATLFLIGAGLSRQVLVSVGIKPLLQGIVLWIFISSASLFAVCHIL